MVEAGWSGTRNGALLRRAAAEFDVFITVDSNIEFQQNTAVIPIAVVVLAAHSNDVAVLRPLMPQVRTLLSELRRRALYRIASSV